MVSPSLPRSTKRTRRLRSCRARLTARGKAGGRSALEPAILAARDAGGLRGRAHTVFMTLDSQICYRALKARDARFDGRFFVAVSSTRIYCRPVCTVKPPTRENCRFYPSAAGRGGGRREAGGGG